MFMAIQDALQTASNYHRVFFSVLVEDDDAEAADSDEDDSNTVSAIPLQEELYIDDPKKALRGFFEREGTP